MKSIHKLRLGTRGSRLALAQAENMRALIEAANPDLEVEICVIRTSGDAGDRFRVGAFVHEIQEAILDGRVDAGLHCLKDLPVEQVPGLKLAAYLEREDSRDALIGRVASVESLSREAVVGTGSVRRTSQLAHVRPDLKFKPLAGNVDTRLRKVMSGEYEAIILAIAGLKRLGLLDQWDSSEFSSLAVTPIPFEAMLPAPGQAVLVLETREDDPQTKSYLAQFDDSDTRTCAVAERAFLQEFGGGCSMPIASFATAADADIELTGLIASPDGSTVLRDTLRASGDPVEIARLLADKLSSQGAKELLAELEVVR